MTRGLVDAVLALAFAAPVASAPPTIAIGASPREVQAFMVFQVSGGVTGGQAGDSVILEAKECGSVTPFHQVGGDQISAGGTWVVTQVGIGATSELRARWRGGVSDPITVQVHPFMTLTRSGPGRYFVWVRAYDFFDGRRAVLERASGSTWVRVRTFTLHRRSSSGAASSTARFRASVKKGTLLRAVLPKSQAGRCYLAGFTNTLKV
jgi:hypothetical protein